MQSEKNKEKKEKTDYFHVHHMIPRHSKYWSDLEHLKEDPLYKVSLTVEGHACQHDVLWRVWGSKGDYIASRCLWGADASDTVNSRFEHCRHNRETKAKIGSSLQEYYKKDPDALERRKEQMRTLGKSGHKRNTTHGTLAMSGPNKRQYMRKHWRKEVWDAIETAWNNRTSYHWGKNSVAKRFGVSVKTVENMHKLIVDNIDWQTATGGEF